MNLSVVTSLFVDGTRGTRLKTMRVYGIHVWYVSVTYYWCVTFVIVDGEIEEYL